MAFDDQQLRSLKAKLRHEKVRTRGVNGGQVSYIEGWHAIAEANRIFGYDSWDRQTSTPVCVWSDRHGGHVACLYSSKVRISVRAGDNLIVRDGIGTGVGRAPFADAAHDIAIKAAETDATKRALATFGNPFGLALYDKEMSYVTEPRKVAGGKAPKDEIVNPTLSVIHPGGRVEAARSAPAFMNAVRKVLRGLDSVEALYAFWEANLPGLMALKEADLRADGQMTEAVLEALKARARELAGVKGPLPRGAKSTTERNQDPPVLLRSKERRIRDQAHLKFVASHPCLICGRQPSHAHHIRFAQPRAMGMKVSDEFTVPLCAGHHDSLHRTGDERAWWAARSIEPLEIARQLWLAESKSEPLSSPLGSCDGSGKSID